MAMSDSVHLSDFDAPGRSDVDQALDVEANDNHYEDLTGSHAVERPASTEKSLDAVVSSHADLPATSARPISAGGLALHSPSSIVGTPFETGPPRFEYPFHTSLYQDGDPAYVPPRSSHGFSSTVDCGNPFCSSSTAFISQLSHSPPASAHLQYPSAHPKLRSPRSAPVPPGIVLKRALLGLGPRSSSAESTTESDLSAGWDESSGSFETAPSSVGSWTDAEMPQEALGFEKDASPRDEGEVEFIEGASRERDEENSEDSGTDSVNGLLEQIVAPHPSTRSKDSFTVPAMPVS